MKILYYNWVQFDDKKNTGGGVTVYLRNVIDYLVKNTEHEVYFLSAGYKYNPFKQGYYIKQTKNIHSEKVNSYVVINSPIIAPTFATYMNIDKYLYNIESYKLFDEFISEHGPFDVIHINNFEGISEIVLKLKEKYPETKFVFSVHNYIPICPLAQYFQGHNNIICNDYREGLECLMCPHVRPSKREYFKYCKRYLLESLQGYKKIFLPLLLMMAKLLDFRSREYIGHKTMLKAENYVKYRRFNIEMLNKYADNILAVSERVRQIMIEHGCVPEKIKTSYIGTKIADNQLNHSSAKVTEVFTIAYLGYERIDKGFFFLIDALSKLDKKTANKINIVLAVKGIHKENYEKQLSLFNNVTVYNGYTHDTLTDILKEVNLGIVPVLWEDNLPQVAIEMVALGVPILCSDFGGASELCDSDLFKFEGGNEQKFIAKLKELISKPELLRQYWENHKPLTTMKKHIEELETFYS